MNPEARDVPGLPSDVPYNQNISGRDSYYRFLIEAARVDFFRAQRVLVRRSSVEERVDVAIYAPMYRRLRSPAELWLAALASEVLNARLGWPGCLARAAFEVFSNVFTSHAYVPPGPDDRPMGSHGVLLTGSGATELSLRDSWSTDPEIAHSVPTSVTLDYLARHGVEYGSQRPADTVGPSARPTDLRPLALSEQEVVQGLQWLADEIEQLAPAPFQELNRDPATGEGFYARELIDLSIEPDYSDLRWVTHLQCVKLALIDGSPAPVITGWAIATLRGSLAVVEDFFIWPTYRQRGSSNNLAFHFLMACNIFGARSLRFLAHEADLASRRHGTTSQRRPSWLRSLAWQSHSLPGSPYMAEIELLDLLPRLVDSP